MRNLLVIFCVLFLLSCAKKDEMRIPAGEYLVKVGDITITKEDIEGLPESVRQLYVGPQGMERFIDETILYQEALKMGLDKDPGYLRMVEYLKKKALVESLLEKEIAQKVKVGDKEVVDYYNKNKDEFKIKETGRLIELESIKEGLRKQILMEKQKKLFDKYLAQLKKTYKVEINQSLMGQQSPSK